MTVPTPDARLAARVAQLEQQLVEVRRELRRRSADSRRTGPRDVRLARTIKDPVTDTYPTAGQTFWVEFLDSHFTANDGDQTPTHTTRKTNVVAHNLRGAWLPEGTIMQAYYQRGLGASGSGEWWLDIIGGIWPAKCTSDITARSGTTTGSGTVDLYLDDTGTLTTTSVEVDLLSDFAAIVSNGTWVIVGQHPDGSWWLVSADCP